jgi:ACS family hexuronate transporter-like MFS transporter
MSTLTGIHQKIGNYRWTICALLFFATTLNYLDRTVIGLLKDNLSELFHWSESDYSNLVIFFQVAYAIGLFGIGAFIDKVGTKIGYAVSVFVWSIATVIHGFATGTTGFIAARTFLGLSESGNFPAANKTVSEWFPRKERALATGLYNSGSNIGAIVAPILVPWLVINWGWQYAFYITGALGIIWLVLWLLIYENPREKKRLSVAELNYINSDNEIGLTMNQNTEKIKWRKLFGYRQTWAFIVGKFFTDPVWWFFLFWLPSFLKSEYGLTGMQISFPLIVVYTVSSFGSIVGGWLPKKLIDKGMDAGKARKHSMLVYAILPLAVLWVQDAGNINMWFAIAIISIACAAHCAWSANIFASVSDMFPKPAVASVTGIGGMAGSIGGILIAKFAGILFDHYKLLGKIGDGYAIMFIICALAYLIAWKIINYLVGNFKPIKEI